MSDAQESAHFTQATPWPQVELTSRQLEVLEVLRTAKSDKYSLADWYLGALYALQNPYNPDRFSQAAQSMRELLEKLPRVFVEVEIQEYRSEIKDLRRDIRKRLGIDKLHYADDWRNNNITSHFDKTIRKIERYFEISQQPSRSEQVESALRKVDPMYEILDHEVKEQKNKAFMGLWSDFEKIAHHKKLSDPAVIFKLIEDCENLILELLAPITAKDQVEIGKLMAVDQPSEDQMARMLELINRRGSNFVYFFKTAETPVWLSILSEKGYFRSPPSVKISQSGQIIVPYWWPIFYLHRMSSKEPDQVVDILLAMGRTKNPRILLEITSMAAEMEDLRLSLRLKPLVKEFLKTPGDWGQAKPLVSLLTAWGSSQEDGLKAACEVLQMIAAFQPDPESDVKIKLRTENPQNWRTSLKPSPRFDPWDYQEILEKGVRTLAEKAPYQVARILLDATANMIPLELHPDDQERLDGDDCADIWCPRLGEPDPNDPDSREVLVQTLTYACEQVYTRSPESIESLDKALRVPQWKVFRRLQRHLYAKFPSQQTLPWIRDEIFAHPDYSDREFTFEFQWMVRSACETLGQDVLNTEEFKQITDAIMAGPSKEEYRAFMAERYTEAAWTQRQRYFHLKQLQPFSPLLTGELKTYFETLVAERVDDPITDESYSPRRISRAGMVQYQSPKSQEELGAMPDEDLLAFLNDWDDQRRDSKDWFIAINIHALAKAFQALFQETILPDESRLAFWLDRKDEIARPVYALAMLESMKAELKTKRFDRLDRWITFCEWVLTHEDAEESEGQPRTSEESKERPNWAGVRRGMVDLIDVCLEKEVNAPLSAREGLARLLQRVCTQRDAWLDQGKTILVHEDDPVTEAINRTRGRGLEALFKFAFWVRRYDEAASIPELSDILEARLAQAEELPITRPEYAILGMHFSDLCLLDASLAIAWRPRLFPQDQAGNWWASFVGYIRWNYPYLKTYEIIGSQFPYALANLGEMMRQGDKGKDTIDRFGQHLYSYFLWEVHELTGENSLLEEFYRQTDADHSYWARLFTHVGSGYAKSDNNLEQNLVERGQAFAAWRVEVGDPVELNDFRSWLEADCLPLAWRLETYNKILDVRGGKPRRLHLEIRALRKMLPEQLPLIMDCFLKITQSLTEDSQMYISETEASPILKAGLESPDESICKKAELARENLLRLGRFDFLE